MAKQSGMLKRQKEEQKARDRVLQDATRQTFAEDVTENLGEYESEARAMEVLGEIADEYGKYLSTAGGPLATVEAFVQPFAYAPPKVYRMPER